MFPWAFKENNHFASAFGAIGCIKVRSSKLSRFSKTFGKYFFKRYKRKTKAKENKKSSGLKNLCFAQLENRSEKAMASRPAGLVNRGNNRLHLSPVQQKSKIPVRITQLSSDSDNSSSSVDEMKKTRHLPRDGADKFPLSRIPIPACVKKNIKGSERLINSTQPTGEQKVSKEESGKLF